MKKFIVFILILLIILFSIGFVTYLFRYDIFKYSTESLIMKNLPDYIRIDDISFDIEKGVLEVRGFRLLNPPGYSNPYLGEIERIICKYKNRGSKITDGITVTDIITENPEIYIERKFNGKSNVEEMQSLIKNVPNKGDFKVVSEAENVSTEGKVPNSREEITKKESGQDNFITNAISSWFSNFNIFDFFDLTDVINIHNGQLFFIDNKLMSPYRVSLKDINGTIRLIFNKKYTELISFETKGSGNVNGYGDQKVEWVSKLETSSPKLTMSNNLAVRDVDIMQFKPYYDKYLPIDILRARASGNFIINFDNGNIGSTNTVKLKDFNFIVKKDSVSSQYWQGAFTEVIKYLTSRKGETFFDFKIKGPMDSPAFYPGPYVKKAIQSMFVDKISDVVQSIQKSQQPSGAGPGPAATGTTPAENPKSDVEKVVDIINVFLDNH